MSSSSRQPPHGLGRPQEPAGPGRSVHATSQHHHPHHVPWEATVSWAEIFEHQKQRRSLIEEWLDWLELEPGNHVADLGSGPGFTSLMAGPRVQPHGRVYAVDHWPEALDFLRRQAALAGIDNIELVEADLGRDDLRSILPVGRVRKATLTHVLHHLGAPRSVIQRLAEGLDVGSRVVVAEFDPDGPGHVGPPPAERIAEAAVAAWLTGAGFRLVRRKRYPDQEQYAFLVERA